RLHHQAGAIVGQGPFQFRHFDAAVVAESDRGQRHILMLAVGGEHFAVLGVHAARDHHSTAAAHAHGHHGGLGGGGGAVVHGGVRYLHAGEFADHGLEFENGLQRALRDFRLVGSVGGEEL